MRILPCLTVLIISILVLLPIKPLRAATESECAIWLCMPVGFLEGCSEAYSAWKKRIKKGKAPLPAFSSCSKGSSGNYKMGVEKWHNCPDGTISLDEYKLYANAYSPSCISIKCLNDNPQNIHRLKQGKPITANCPIVYRKQRQKQNYIEIWMEKKSLGRFFY